MEFLRKPKNLLIAALVVLGLILVAKPQIPLILDTWDILSGKGVIVNSDRVITAHNVKEKLANYKSYPDSLPNSIKSTLPKKSLDGKDIDSFFLSDDSNYLIFNTFVRRGGAGPVNDYWSLNRSTGEQINLSKLISNESNYIKNYKEISAHFKKDYSLFHLVFYGQWIGNNPVFQVSDGWAIGNEAWEYDFKNNYFTFIPHFTD